ncbi:tyrosinase family protein [Roseobacter sp.]|uniref:tyrosinase family protein n=1 Tax=Roseobacter sp. TaxID=1907202 RepID=UPI0025F4A548|nr:tyrosinase family protein [Roseobacter sp.]
MTHRVRKSVWGLPDGDETLMWYERAVEALWQLPVDDPRGWWFMGAVHGVPPSFPNIAARAQFWDQCQHQSWFFLPWHRGYIAAFEAVIAQEVASLGGPEDWALPYWNYSQDLADNPDARRLPSPFRDQLKPDGTRNYLFSRRRLVMNGDFGLTDQIVSLAAMEFAGFTDTKPGAPSGFGGPVTGFNRGGGDSGALEQMPHNVIHVEIGGFMRDPRTAAFDPVFWLHHCNIDRLWETWRQDPLHADPDSPLWLTGQSFDMHDGQGQPFSYTAQDMLDTTQILHGYLYDTIPSPVSPGGAAPDDTEALAMSSSGDPDLAGASETPVRLGRTVTRTRVQMNPDVALAGPEEAPGSTRRVYLELQGIRGTGAAGNYAVLIDLPGDNMVPVRAGVLSTFGHARASRADAPHGGSGLNQVFDITAHAFTLGLARGDTEALEVLIEPMGAADQAWGVPPGLEGVVAETDEPAEVTIGRINVIFE